ncbi:MAG: hypothetical protein QM610_00975 [Chitinophagaceae bacterium]
MKTTIRLVSLFLMFIFGISCKAQLMQTLNDADKIQSNKEYYVGKPLSVLLKDIKPKIITYSPLPDATATKTAGLSLLFESYPNHLRKTSDIKRGKDGPAVIGVYFTDIGAVHNIIKNRRGQWTQGLSDSLSNLIIKRVHAYGKN